MLQCRGRLKCDGTSAETRFRLSVKRASPFQSVGASVQSTAGSRDVRISGSNAGYTMFRGSVNGTDYPLHSTVSPSLPLPFITMCHHISTGVKHATLRLLTQFNNLLHTTSFEAVAVTEFNGISSGTQPRQDVTLLRRFGS